MIVIRIELWPKGDKSQARHLGTATIVNDNTGTPRIGNYKVFLSKWGRPNEAWKQGALLNFPRKTRGSWDMLYLALKALIGNRNN